MSLKLQTIFVLLVLLHTSHHTKENEDQRLWEKAKKEFARRTREYVKQNPISPELQEFIDEYSRSRRRKRQDHRNMYAIKDGEVVPLAQIEEQMNTRSNLGENFTVVPLIIPIGLQNTMTLKYRKNTEESNFEGGSTNIEHGILGRGEALQAVKNKIQNKTTDQVADETDETVVDSLIDDKLKSTTDSTRVDKLLENVQNLIISQKKGRGINAKEGALCNVTGYWDSESGGVTFHIKKTENGPLIKMKPLEPPSEEGFIPHTQWNLTATIPFPQTAQVIITLTAHKGRRVALFLGECRVCDGSETITGDWLVGRVSSNCKDQKATHSFISDVLKKNNVETLREDHLKKISSLEPETSTTEMSP